MAKQRKQFFIELGKREPDEAVQCIMRSQVSHENATDEEVTELLAHYVECAYSLCTNLDPHGIWDRRGLMAEGVELFTWHDSEWVHYQSSGTEELAEYLAGVEDAHLKFVYANGRRIREYHVQTNFPDNA